MEKRYDHNDIADRIWWDICGRSGLDLGALDKDVQDDIRKSWAKIVNEVTDARIQKLEGALQAIVNEIPSIDERIFADKVKGIASKALQDKREDVR